MWQFILSSNCPIYQLSFRELPTDGIWDLSELDGRVPARPQGPDRWSVSRISYAVARGRTRFLARRTRGAISPILPKPVDQTDCGTPPIVTARRLSHPSPSSRLAESPSKRGLDGPWMLPRHSLVVDGWASPAHPSPSNRVLDGIPLSSG